MNIKGKSGWEFWLELLGDGMIIASGALALLICVPIAVFGEVLTYEDNPVILFAEIALGVLIIILGINRLRNDFKGGLK